MVALTVIGILLATILFFARIQRINRGIGKILTEAKEDKTLPHTHEWELYHNEQAPSQRIRACLAELNIP